MADSESSPAVVTTSTTGDRLLVASLNAFNTSSLIKSAGFFFSSGLSSPLFYFPPIITSLPSGTAAWFPVFHFAGVLTVLLFAFILLLRLTIV